MAMVHQSTPYHWWAITPKSLFKFLSCIPSSSIMNPVAIEGSPGITPNNWGGIEIDSVKFSVDSAIGSSVIGISINDVMAPGKKMTLLKKESKSTPSPV